MELTVLTVPDCANGPALLEALPEVLAAHPGARLSRQVVRDEAEAIRLGMHGSPTLLIDGADPFAAPGTRASVSCRIYRDETGRACGVPAAGDPVPLASERSTAATARQAGAEASQPASLSRAA